MKKRGSFATGAGWLIAGDAFAKIAGFLFVVLVARGLGARDYGYLNFAISFVPLFLIMSTWGIDDLLFRQVAKQPAALSGLFANAFRLRLSLATAALLLSFAVGAFFVGASDAYVVLVIVGIALWMDEIATSVSTVFKAFEQMRLRAMRIIINRIATTLLALGVLWLGGGLLLVCAAYLAGSFVALGFSWITLRRQFPPIDLRLASRGDMRRLLARGAPIAVAAVATMAVFRIDAVMLQAMEGPVAVGLYGVAYRFLDSLLFVAWGLGSAAVPRMSRARDVHVVNGVFTATWAVALAFYLPLAVGAPFASVWAVTTVFGERYAEAAAAVPWLLSAGVAYGSAHLLRMALLALDRRRAMAWIAGSALIVNVAGNVYAITTFGFVGAAVMTFISGVFELLLLLAVYHRATGEAPGLPLLLLPLSASAVLGAALLATGLRDLAAVGAGTLVYVTALALGVVALGPSRVRQHLAPLRRA